MGTLYWQLNDCWPVASWSSRDYYGNWKALHFTAQDVFSPISLSQKLDRDGRISVWVMTDLAVDIQDTLIISIYNLDGGVAHKVTDLINKKVEDSELIYNQKIKINDNQFIVAELKNKQVKSKTLFTAEIKNLNFKKPTISYQIKNNTIILQTDIPAFEVYLHGVKGQFSDNFFSLLPGEEKIIEIETPEFNPNNLVIWSLYDLNKN
jgi:beta-mannosidase